MKIKPPKTKNLIFKQDIIQRLKSTPDDTFDLIYGDPDYNVGINYQGEKYTKKWDEYIKWYEILATEAYRILKPQGNIFLINYPKQNAYLRVNCLDKIAYNVHDYVWVYNTNIGHSKSKFTNAHRSILHITKSKDNKFYKDQIAEPYKNINDKRIRDKIAGGSTGHMPYSWMYYDLVKNVSKEKTLHACQIPQDLVRKLFLATTKENDDIFILFGGSGNEIILAKEMGRNSISCEINQTYYDLIKQKLS